MNFYLPKVIMAQPSSLAVKEGKVEPGDWMLRDVDGDPVNMRRFKAVFLSHRPIVAEWNPATSTYTVLTNTLDIRFDIWRRRVGNRTHDGSPEYSGCIQFLVWLPHYSRPAILHTTARTAVREFMGVQIGELYGIKSQQNRVGNRFVFYTPVVTALDGLNYIVDPMLKSVPPEMSEAFNLGDPMLGGLTESVTVV